MENFVLVLIYILIGTQLRRLPQFPANTGMVLNQYVLMVALPALVLQKMPLLQLSSQLLVAAILPWILLAVTAVLVLVAAKLWHWERSTIGALLVVLPLGNTAFLGYPMIEALMGADALPIAIIYDQAGSFLALVSYAAVLAAWYGNASEKPTVLGMAKRIFFFPAFMAMLVGLALKGWEYPGLMKNFLDSLAVTLVPVVMVAVGFQFRLQLDAKEKAPLAFALVVKLMLLPAIAFVLLWLIAAESRIQQVAVLQAAMPPMVSAGALAIGAGLAPRLVSTLVGVGLILSFLSLPLWAWWLGVW
ncbi:AEC family transporter [Aliiglaciecola sp. CAU 1673]|uniref:AEC family transporter n=1 Tax=Aliiglaciecola sp. CAU 1673 TaxID=3032595 RepID=UPI0023DC2502|nr:AEC family transporter [Aliiglaciecola sp. CAU 1673]MDF2178484.1 AEC family transporter [Aliiglaciecola sp. CAU 1673]